MDWLTHHPLPAAGLAVALAMVLNKVLTLVWPLIWKATSNEGLVSQTQCAEEMAAGNELFRLVLEGQGLIIQALVQLCPDDDEPCRKVRAKLEAHMLQLVARKIIREANHG